MKIVAQAIQNVGVNPQRIAAYVHTNTFNIPGYAFPLRWTAWGELTGPRVAVRRPDQGAAARARAEHRRQDLVAEGGVQVAAADALPSTVVASEAESAPRSRRGHEALRRSPGRRRRDVRDRRRRHRRRRRSERGREEHAPEGHRRARAADTRQRPARRCAGRRSHRASGPAQGNRDGHAAAASLRLDDGPRERRPRRDVRRRRRRRRRARGEAAGGRGVGVRRAREAGRPAGLEPEPPPAAVPRAGEGARGPAEGAAARRGDGGSQRGGARRLGRDRAERPRPARNDHLVGRARDERRRSSSPSERSSSTSARSSPRARPRSSCGTRRSSTRISGGRALLEVAGLAAGYLGERVIDGIDLEVRTGEAVAIVGSNGAGKTTLFRAIAGLLPTMEGRVVLDGKDLTRRPAHRDRARGDRVRSGRAAPVPGDDPEEQPGPGRLSQAAGPRDARARVRPLPAPEGATAPAGGNPERWRAADARRRAARSWRGRGC